MDSYDNNTSELICLALARELWMGPHLHEEQKISPTSGM